MKRLMVIIGLCVFSSPALAFKFTAETCQKYGLGKYWYCEEAPDKNEIGVKEIMNSSMSPEDKATQLNQLWEVQRKRAVITGERQEIEKFLETHNLIINKGIDFAKNTQGLIEATPTLANSNSYYKNMHEQNIREQEYNDILENSNKRYGLVFVYSSGCQHCHRQLPIILKLQDKFKVMGISVDGNYFEGLDENIVDENIANDPLVQAYPTILLLDKAKPAKIFISKGLTSLTELEEKIVKRISERQNEEK
ncbi:MAG: conjugal transfer protein TraF [Pseudomonadota bacterium]